MFIYLVSTGLLTGLLSSFFGVGGGILAVPALYWIMPALPTEVIISSSLGMIFFNAIINLYHFHQSGNTALPKLYSFMGASMGMGVFTSGIMSGYLDAQTIKLILAVMLFCICVKDILHFNKKQQGLKEFSPSKVRFFPVSLICFLAGCISGITGLGGGVILIPLFIYVLRFPLSKIPVYSNACMAVGSFIGILTYMLLPVRHDIQWDGFLSYFQIGHVNLGVSLILSMGGLLTSRWGVSLHQKISPKKAKIFFIIFLLLVSVKIASDVIS